MMDELDIKKLKAYFAANFSEYKDMTEELSNETYGYLDGMTLDAINTALDRYLTDKMHKDLNG